MIDAVDDPQPARASAEQPRPSRCMRAAKAAERDRIMAMSVRERIELAFALGRKYSALSRLTTRAEP